MLLWLLVAASHAFTVDVTEGGAIKRWPAMPIPWVLDTAEAPPSLEPLALIHAVERAFGTWEQVPGASIAFEGGATDAPAEGDNVVRFDPEWPWGEEMAALTYTASVVEDGRIVWFEIVVNGTMEWGVGEDLDLESGLAHELGHAIGVEHSDIDDAVMFGSLEFAELRRGLHEDDEDAARFLYPTLEQVETLGCDVAAHPAGALATVLVTLLMRRNVRARR